MTADNFERSLAAVLKHEGGWADHPADPGGATMKGVTLGTYRRYKPGATKADLRKITDAELKRIYRDGYWNKVRGDELPKGVDYAVFDFAVNSGMGRAIPFLQRVVGVTADGHLGPLTLAAVDRKGAAAVITDLCDARLAWLKRLDTWATFGKGWSSRVNGVKKLGLIMAREAPVQAVRPPPDIPAPERPVVPVDAVLDDHRETDAIQVPAAPASPQGNWFTRFFRWLFS